MNTVFPDPEELMPQSGPAEATTPVTTPQPASAALPASSKKMGRPLKRLSEQDPRTEQNKRARFEKEIREVEGKHERSVSSLKETEMNATIASKISGFYSSLPPKSPLRQSVLHHFTKGEDPSVMAKFFGVSRQTIEQAQELKDEDNTTLQLKYAIGVTREKIPASHLTRIQDFWYENTILVPLKTSVTYKGNHKEKASFFYSL